MSQTKEKDSKCQLTASQALEAYKCLRSAYPDLDEFFSEIGIIEMPAAPIHGIDVAFTKIVIGQLLSGKATATIFKRVEESMLANGAMYSWTLDDQLLRACGVSSRKVRTLKEFGQIYEADPQSVMAWKELAYNELRLEMGKIWGVADWSTSMLAIFYFGNEDVYPQADGSVLRALDYVKRFHLKGRKKLDPHACTPFRSYLALYLWRALDTGYWQKRSINMKR